MDPGVQLTAINALVKLSKQAIKAHSSGPGPVLEECWLHKWAEPKSRLTFGRKIPDIIKTGTHRARIPFFGQTSWQPNNGDFKINWDANRGRDNSAGGSKADNGDWSWRGWRGSFRRLDKQQDRGHLQKIEAWGPKAVQAVQEIPQNVLQAAWTWCPKPSVSEGESLVESLLMMQILSTMHVLNCSLQND